MPIEGGGWLVTFRHDPMAGWEVEDGMDRDREGVGLTGTGRPDHGTVKLGRKSVTVFQPRSESSGDG